MIFKEYLHNIITVFCIIFVQNTCRKYSPLRKRLYSVKQIPITINQVYDGRDVAARGDDGSDAGKV